MFLSEEDYNEESQNHFVDEEVDLECSSTKRSLQLSQSHDNMFDHNNNNNTYVQINNNVGDEAIGRYDIGMGHHGQSTDT